MWFSESEGPSYVLLITVLIILAIFALLVFGSLPCSCKYLVLLNHCLWSRKNRVANSELNNRIHVIGAGVPDPESLVQFPIFPFATDPHLPNGRRPTRVVHVNRELTTQLPCYYEISQNQLKFPPCRWEEPPPPYDSLYPGEQSGSAKVDGGGVDHDDTCKKNRPPPV